MATTIPEVIRQLDRMYGQLGREAETSTDERRRVLLEQLQSHVKDVTTDVQNYQKEFLHGKA